MLMDFDPGITGIASQPFWLQKPPADCLIAMGKMAGPPAGWYFWKLAGIEPDDARRMLKDV